MPETPSDPSRWGAIARGLRAAGGVTARGAAAVGRAARGAYLAIDPDVRRHVAESPIVGLSFLTPRATALPDLADDGHRPLVFVHGLGGHPGNFVVLQTYLRLLGRRRTHAVSFPDTRAIVVMADHLRDVVEQVWTGAGLTDGRGVDLVCHSMGGLVARVALEDPLFAARIHTVVTLGTPHGGSHLARLASTQNVLDLRPGSPLLGRLDAQLPWRGHPSQPRLVAFWSEGDTILLPHTSAQLDGAEQVELPGTTHYGYLFRPSALARIHHKLLG